MKKKYKVLWVDDEWQELKKIQQMAVDHSIFFQAFKNAEDAAENLKKNFMIYDAIILDGIFYDKKNEIGMPVSETAMMKMVNLINQLKNKKNIPWFVLTGRSRIAEGTDFLKSLNKTSHVFRKTDDNQIEKLFAQLKYEANKQLETQLLHNYQDAFEIFDNYLKFENSKYLVDVLKIVHSKNSASYNNYNAIRHVYEILFDKLREKKIIPPQLTQFNRVANILVNEERNFAITKPIIHPTICYLIYSQCDILQDGSHATERLNLNIQEYCTTRIGKHLFHSSVSALLEVLIYFNRFFNENPDVILNSETWKELPIIATLDLDKNGDYFYETFLFNRNEIKKRGYHFNKKLKILEINRNTLWNSDKYPFYVRKFIPI